jgi:cell division protein FtsL
MMVRLIHVTVAAALIVAAAYVYKIKFDSTTRAAEVTQLAAAIKRERDATAALKAEWAQLENPVRIQRLAERHLKLRMLDPAQIDHLDHLPERPAPAPQGDAIAAMIDAIEGAPPVGVQPPPAPSPRAGTEIQGAPADAPR